MPQATAPRTAQPLLEQGDRLAGRQAVDDLAELLLEQVGAVEGPVYQLDVGELGRLSDPLDVEPQHVPNASHRWPVAERRMGAPLVVVGKPVWQRLAASVA